MAKGTKNINIEVSINTWKRLKVMSIAQDTTLQEIVSEVLDKFASSKKADSLLGVEEVEK